MPDPRKLVAHASILIEVDEQKGESIVTNYSLGSTTLNPRNVALFHRTLSKMKRQAWKDFRETRMKHKTPGWFQRLRISWNSFRDTWISIVKKSGP